ncbi:acyltransferase family protein [Fervidobacterium islandicum]|uniref:acyltransferase family protein n=1 Tax=Fervidobacterium islandicum TaxID=2423 RepID=UPI003A69779B
MGESKKRELWIDYTRGTALIMVVLAHSQVPEKMFAFISYVIVVFPFLSGYLMKALSFREFFKKRITMVISYYYIGLIGYIVWILTVPEGFRKADNLTYLKNFLLVRTDLLDQIPLTIVPLWYLIFLFVAEFFFLLFSKFHILPYTLALGIFLRFIQPGALPFKVDVAFSGLYMFWLGKLVKEKKKDFERYLGVIGFTGLIVWTLVALFVDGTSWNMDHYGINPILTLAGELGTAMFFLWIGKDIEQFAINSTNKDGLMRRFIAKYVLYIPKLFSDNAIFAFGYHILIGGLVVLFTMALGFVVTEETLRQYWYIAFALTFGAMTMLMVLLPNSVKLLLTQPDLFVNGLRKERSSEK